MLILKSVIAVAETPQIDPNGIPILKGYRPPFKEGYDPRRFNIGAYRKANPPPPKAKRNVNRTLAAIRRSFYAYCKSARDYANDPALALGHAKVARMFFDMEQQLLGNTSPRSKRSKSTPVSIPDFPLPDSGNQSVTTPIAKPALEKPQENSGEHSISRETSDRGTGQTTKSQEQSSSPPVTDDTPF